MRGTFAAVAVLGALAFGAQPASAVPVVIEGTPYEDHIFISGQSPVSFSYGSEMFPAVTSLTINAHGGSDEVWITNPQNVLFAPPLGIRINGGEGDDQVRVASGRAAVGRMEHGVDGAGTSTITHIGAGAQKIVLDSVATVTDDVAETSYTYAATSGSDTIGLDGPSIANGGERVTPDNKGSVVVDSLASASTPDRVVMRGAEPIAPELVVDDGRATPEDVIDLDYHPGLGGAAVVRVRAARVEGAGAFNGRALGLEAPQLAPGSGVLTTYTDKLEVESNSTVRVKNDRKLEVGGVSYDLSGVRSNAGDVSVDTPGKLTIGPGDEVKGRLTATLSSDGLDILGRVAAQGGWAQLVPRTAGLPIDLGEVTNPAGEYNVSDAEIDQVDASRILLGAPDSGELTVSAPFSSETVSLELTSGGGFSGTGGAIEAPSLWLEDGSGTGRAWKIDPAGVRAGDGDPIPYAVTGEIFLRGGSGADSFDVDASPTTQYSIDGGDPSTVPGDALVFRVRDGVSGSTDPPAGVIESPNRKHVVFQAMETVSFVPAMSDPLTIQGTDGDDLIRVQALTPVAGTYSVNGGPEQAFVSATYARIEAGAGHDRVEIANPPGGLFAPPLGAVVSGGEGMDTVTNEGGLAVEGGFDRHPVPTFRHPTDDVRITHTGAGIQDVFLSSVENVTDSVPEQKWTYLASAGPSDIALADQPPTEIGARCCGSQYIRDEWGTVDPNGKSAVVMDTRGGGAAPDVVTLTGHWPLAPSLTIDDGEATPGLIARVDNYNARSSRDHESALVSNVSVRAATLESVGGSYDFDVTSLALDVGSIQYGPRGELDIRTGKLEARAATGDVLVDNGDRLQVGGISDSLTGVEAHGGQARVTVLGPLTVAAGEEIASRDNVSLKSHDIDLQGNVHSDVGSAHLQPSSGGSVDLGSTAAAAGYEVSQAELDRVGVRFDRGVLVGATESGQFTISAPIDAGHLTLYSGGGFTATPGALLSTTTLDVHNREPAGRDWDVGPAFFRVGAGAAVPFETQTLRLQGGDGADSFTVRPGSSTGYQLHGGGPTTAPGDVLVYDAEGRTVSGDTTAPTGSIESPGVSSVFFAEFEDVSVVGTP